jgi:prepilin-type N-terminal cleavage/methylation domain-containing protein/prepilin-type processing-associated H-X9-DG protein
MICNQENTMKLARRSFTLLELLLVVCIILILASLLYPSFVRAKQMAKIAVCTSNLKQLNFGFSQFEKNARRLPPGGNRYDEFKNIGWAYDESVSWDDRIAAYLSRDLTDSEYLAWTVDRKSATDDLLRCPSDRDKHPVKLVRTYSVNAYGLWGSQSGAGPAYAIPPSTNTGVIGLMLSRRSSEVNQTASCYLLTEGFNGSQKFAGNGWYSALARDWDFAPYQYHNGKRVALYIDGHAQIIANSQLIPGTDSFTQNVSVQ